MIPSPTSIASGLLTPASQVPGDVAERIQELGQQIDALSTEQAALAAAAGLQDEPVTRLTIFNGYMFVGVVAFLVTLCATPIVRRLAIANGVVDMPSESRKVHRRPIAYMGGVAVFVGLLAGILYSYFAYPIEGLISFHATEHASIETGYRPSQLPISILLGITVIMLVGLLDDIIGVPPWQKVGGQLFAAAALAYQDVGVKVAAGVLGPIAHWLGLGDLVFTIPIPGVDMPLELDLMYWAGTGIIAVFVLGGCNAANLIDGLDGLLSGVTAIAAAGLLFVALSLALIDDGPRDGQRLVLVLALLGACLGFIPHNFNPATIFLGDCGSLLLGFTTVVVILTLGDTGKTYLVFAGLFIYAIPIIDTVLAIVRRKLSGKSISDADDQHLHHMLKRALGVKGAVLVLYAFGLGFALLGIAMSLGRARVIYALALVFAAYIGVTAIKIARKRIIDEDADRKVRARLAQAAERARRHAKPGRAPSVPASASAPADAPPTGSSSEQPASPQG
ncbi:MAG: MraY family glycosyltransferase [Planctomycetota bacterium]